MFVRIVASHFVAGVESLDRKIIKTAPILSYMMGWDIKKVIIYCKKKRWKVERIL